ncbi:hypothetical protein [Streptomyces cavourensis]|uniref:hypothetical protein n=1 Tax=Streptomyces cavourensis TaxID=67258 RepID=UPI000DC6599A|nr:hypothetical protein [Streptomyces cavourensis]ATY97218.1 hypothetical protein CVT27_18510 [Streptomyces cavourensis]
MSTPTMGDLTAPVTVLTSLMARFPGLPGVTVRICPIFPDQVELAVHDDLTAFEAWREALEISPEKVVHRVQSQGTTHVLDVHTVLMGARLRLVAYADILGRVPSLGAVS